MRVRFTTSIAFNHGGSVATYAFGDEAELPDPDAQALIAAGQAEPAQEPPEPVDVETAVPARPEEKHAVRLPKRGGQKEV